MGLPAIGLHRGCDPLREATGQPGRLTLGYTAQKPQKKPRRGGVKVARLPPKVDHYCATSVERRWVCNPHLGPKKKKPRRSEALLTGIANTGSKPFL